MLGLLEFHDPDTFGCEYCFAWFDTVRGQWLNFGGQGVWETWEEFVQDYEPTRAFPDLEMFRRLMPGLNQRLPDIDLLDVGF